MRFDFCKAASKTNPLWWFYCNAEKQKGKEPLGLRVNPANGKVESMELLLLQLCGYGGANEAFVELPAHIF